MKKLTLMSLGIIFSFGSLFSQENSVEEVIVTATKTERTLQEVPVAVSVVTAETNLRNVVIKMTENPQGAALVLDDESLLLGIVTEGDLRRSLAENINIDNSEAEEVMSQKPITIKIDSLMSEVLSVMENRESQISVLPVVNDDMKCVGLIRIHDIYQTQLL